MGTFLLCGLPVSSPGGAGRSTIAPSRSAFGRIESPFLFNNDWLLIDFQDETASCVGEVASETRRSPLGTSV